MRFEELTLEGRNAVLEAFRAKRTIDRLFVQKGLNDGPINTILREAKKTDAVIQFMDKEKLDQIKNESSAVDARINELNKLKADAAAYIQKGAQNHTDDPAPPSNT